MTNSQRLAKARSCFLHWIAERSNSDSNDPASSEDAIIREGMVIRDDFFLGRRFVGQDYDAIWFIEEDELKIFNAQGKVVTALHRDEIDLRSAAQGKQSDNAEHSQVIALPQTENEPRISNQDPKANDLDSGTSQDRRAA
jgi:hypothetical protein